MKPLPMNKEKRAPSIFRQAHHYPLLSHRVSSLGYKLSCHQIFNLRTSPLQFLPPDHTPPSPAWTSTSSNHPLPPTFREHKRILTSLKPRSLPRITCRN